jgi:hypothetical protein
LKQARDKETILQPKRMLPFYKVHALVLAHPRKLPLPINAKPVKHLN